MAAPPSGTITFLLTDIEGSTRMWEKSQEKMRAALAHFDAVLRSAIEAHGGHVFKTVGDAFCAASPTAPEALEAALCAQPALQVNKSWGEVGPLLVRMLVHTGSAEERDGEYLGPPLNRVTRFLSAAHGGQTLLSLPTQELVRDQLPVDTELRDLGQHRLKDLARPEGSCTRDAREPFAVRYPHPSSPTYLGYVTGYDRSPDSVAAGRFMQ